MNLQMANVRPAGSALQSKPCATSLITRPSYTRTWALARCTGRRSACARRLLLPVQATAQQDKAGIEKLSEDIGLPTDEGLFGFKPFSEVWVGRLAMGGFVSSILVEGTTGRGTLQQIGLITPSLPLFATILALAGSATAIASARTLYRAQNKQMTGNELVRYRQFLGIQKENENIASSRKDGTPADRVLGPDDVTSGGPEEAGASVVPGQEPTAADIGRPDVVTQPQFKNEGLQYARTVEVSQGRWAMVGFLSAILVEAATGKGILGQLISYLKFLGLLGPASGF